MPKDNRHTYNSTFIHPFSRALAFSFLTICTTGSRRRTIHILASLWIAIYMVTYVPHDSPFSHPSRALLDYDQSHQESVFMFFLCRRHIHGIWEWTRLARMTIHQSGLVSAMSLAFLMSPPSSPPSFVVSLFTHVTQS